MSDPTKKFLIVNYSGVKVVAEIDKGQLTYVKDGSIDAIVNLEDLTYFDAETNAWLEVPKGV